MEILTRRLWSSSLLLRVGQVCSLQLSTTASACNGLASSLNKPCHPKANTILSPFNFQFQHRTLYHHPITKPHLAHQLPPTVLSLIGRQVQPAVVTVPARTLVNHRWVNYKKDRGKKKSVKAVMKRFHRTGSGKLKYWPAGKVHNMLCKSYNYRQRLRKPRYATKKQLKMLNKMIAGW